ncbi:MAG TPA: cupin domain-containing protein [Dongiaceae bacterium]|jgi:predicted cupin superfamily sugar epimerase|nr:cupin domain-containing protein [Dongiaceae bacterium]
MHAADIVKQLGLQPHPEGGYFRETYRAAEAIPIVGLDRRYGGARAISTAIYYLLEAGQRSALHRLASDEIFHFYAGEPLRIIEIAPDGGFTETLLGADFAAGAIPQHVIPAGAWFGAVPTGRFSLVGCTVAPGFDFADFELGETAALLAAFPQHEAWIRRLT